MLRFSSCDEARKPLRWGPTVRTMAGRSPRDGFEGDTVRCPWHHACFSLRTGEALGAPALSPIDCFNVEERDGKVYVLSKKPIPQKKRAERTPENIVIVGGGAAAQAASEMLRREGFAGRLTLISHDAAPPVDRRISRKTTSRVPRPKNGFRFAHPSFMQSRASNWCSARESRASMSVAKR